MSWDQKWDEHSGERKLGINIGWSTQTDFNDLAEGFGGSNNLTRSETWKRDKPSFFVGTEM